MRQARKHGLRATHYVSSKLIPAELELAEAGLDGSLVAGASRATRLGLIEADTTTEQRAIIDTFSSVFGPLILAFSQWLIDNCIAQGIGDIFFSRERRSNNSRSMPGANPE